jgi:PAS domain S-box-containing protein
MATFLRTRSGRTYIAFVCVCAAVAAILGYAQYRSSIGWFEKNKFEEKVTALKLVEAFVASYTQIRSRHLAEDAPVPATFRAHSIASFTADSQLDSSLTIDWLGVPGRQIRRAPKDPLTAEALLGYAASENPKPHSHWREADGQPVFRTITPSIATQESCVQCHNKYVSDGRPWRLGEVMGAFVFDVPAGAFLKESRKEAILLGSSFLLLSGVLGLAFFRMQHQRHLADVSAAAAVERERRSQEAEVSRRLLQAIIDQLPARISVKDEQERYILVNKLQADEFGCTPEEALGKTRADFPKKNAKGIAGAAFCADIQNRDKAVLATGQAILSYEETVMCTDGSTEHSLSNKAPLFDASGAVIGVLTVAMDITSQKRTERMLRDARSLAEEANRMKSEFLANMSHELRTPLNAVIGFSEIIREALFGPVDARYRGYAADIHKSGSHLLALINDVLDLSKIEAGRMELRLAPASVEDMVTSCHHMIAESAKRGGVEVELALQPDLPCVNVDALRFQQILLNLLSNAVKFTPSGGRVTVCATAASDAVTVAVEDTGIGMKREDIAAAFEPFRQIDGSLSRRYEGTGLGLPLARKLAEMHGGRIEIASALGKGTRASIVIPTMSAEREVA